MDRFGQFFSPITFPQNEKIFLPTNNNGVSRRADCILLDANYHSDFAHRRRPNEIDGRFLMPPRDCRRSSSRFLSNQTDSMSRSMRLAQADHTQDGGGSSLQQHSHRQFRLAEHAISSISGRPDIATVINVPPYNEQAPAFYDRQSHAAQSYKSPRLNSQYFTSGSSGHDPTATGHGDSHEPSKAWESSSLELSEMTDPYFQGGSVSGSVMGQPQDSLIHNTDLTVDTNPSISQRSFQGNGFLGETQENAVVSRRLGTKDALAQSVCSAQSAPTHGAAEFIPSTSRTLTSNHFGGNATDQHLPSAGFGLSPMIYSRSASSNDMSRGSYYHPSTTDVAWTDISGDNAEPSLVVSNSQQFLGADNEFTPSGSTDLSLPGLNEAGHNRSSSVGSSLIDFQSTPSYDLMSTYLRLADHSGQSRSDRADNMWTTDTASWAISRSNNSAASPELFMPYSGRISSPSSGLSLFSGYGDGYNSDGVPAEPYLDATHATISDQMSQSWETSLLDGLRTDLMSYEMVSRPQKHLSEMASASGRVEEEAPHEPQRYSILPASTEQMTSVHAREHDTQAPGGKVDSGEGKSSVPSSIECSNKKVQRDSKTRWRHHTPGTAKTSMKIQSHRKQSKGMGPRRLGPLTSEQKANARHMRSIRACWHCSIARITCKRKDNEPCEACLSANSPLDGISCVSARLTDFAEMFLPLPAVYRYESLAVQHTLSENVRGYCYDSIDICLSTGLSYPPIPVVVKEFSHASQDFLSFKIFQSGTARFQKYYAPPLGLDPARSVGSALEEKLWDHIRKVCKLKRNYGEVTMGDTSQLHWDVYRVIQNHAWSNPDNHLLQDLIALYSMQYIMNTSVFMLAESFKNVKSKLQQPSHLPYMPMAVARLLNIQIKQVLLSMIRTTYRKVLMHLEKELKKPRRRDWTTCFCSIMILSMCAEMVQTTTDFRMTSDKDEGKELPSHGTSLEHLTILERRAIGACTKIFHEAFKTERSRYAKGREKAFNPLRDGIENDLDAGTDVGSKDLIDSIRGIMSENHDQLQDLVATPDFNEDRTLAKHLYFRNRNSGRLVAAFLLSFKVF